MSNYLPDDGPKPYLSAGEVRAVRIDEVKKGGLNPGQVADALARCAVTIEVLTETLDQLHKEHLDLLNDQAASNASVQATKMLEAAAKASEDLVAGARAEAAEMEASIAERKRQADEEFAQYEAEMTKKREALEGDHEAAASALQAKRDEIEAGIVAKSEEADRAHAAKLDSQAAEIQKMSQIADAWKERFGVSRQQFEAQIVETLGSVDAMFAELGQVAKDEVFVQPEQIEADDSSAASFEAWSSEGHGEIPVSYWPTDKPADPFGTQQ